jgi:uncharacterized membrane protein
MSPQPFLAQTSLMGDWHSTWGWIAIGINGVVGLWGLLLAVLRRSPGTAFYLGVGVAVVSMLAQVGMGLWAFAVDQVQPGNQHVFYGVVVSFTFAFAYIYRAQLAKRPALSWGLLLLFVMGLGIRGITTFGQSF